MTVLTQVSRVLCGQADLVFVIYGAYLVSFNMSTGVMVSQENDVYAVMFLLIYVSSD
jgi:hypothetical protein